MNGPWVLMYHRVCERGADTRCWFERGTAVTPASFDRQLAWLRERFAIVPLEDLHAPTRAGDLPRVALTFDDGYADTLEIAAPVAARHGVVATCFAAAGPARGGPALWFDTWYSLVHVGLGQPGWDAALERLGIPPAPEIATCVRGSAKHSLAGLAPGPRLDVLASLARALGISLPAPHYLDLDGLRRLRHLGWRVGGHGVEHRRLGDCDQATLTRELRESRELLADIGEEGPLLFAYPDGSWNELVVRSTAAAGFALACTVERAPWTDPRERFTVPRVFCREDAVAFALPVSR